MCSFVEQMAFALQVHLTTDSISLIHQCKIVELLMRTCVVSR